LPFNLQVVRFFEGYEATLAPFIKDRGLDWEVKKRNKFNSILLNIFQIAVIESDANLWRENGLIPPLPNSKAEQEWGRLNKPVPYSEVDNVCFLIIIN
jgi:hypothetical protein